MVLVQWKTHGKQLLSKAKASRNKKKLRDALEVTAEMGLGSMPEWEDAKQLLEGNNNAATKPKPDAPTPPSTAASAESEPARHPRYKTELCTHWLVHGSCTYGKERCNFAHGEADLRKPNYGTRKTKGSTSSPPPAEKEPAKGQPTQKSDPKPKATALAKSPDSVWEIRKANSPPLKPVEPQPMATALEDTDITETLPRQYASSRSSSANSEMALFGPSPLSGPNHDTLSPKLDPFGVYHSSDPGAIGAPSSTWNGTPAESHQPVFVPESSPLSETFEAPWGSAVEENAGWPWETEQQQLPLGRSKFSPDVSPFTPLPSAPGQPPSAETSPSHQQPVTVNGWNSDGLPTYQQSQHEHLHCGLGDWSHPKSAPDVSVIHILY